MRHTKNIAYFLLLLLSSFGWTACEFGGVEDATPDFKESALVIATTEEAILNLNQLSASRVAFELDAIGQPVSSVQVQKSFVRGGQVMGTAEGATINSLPATVELGLDEALSGLGVAAEELVLNDRVVYTFIATLASGEIVRIGNQNSVVATATCPVPESSFVGTYTVASDDCGYWTGDAAFSVVEGTVRRIEGTFLGFAVSMTIDLACGEVLVPSQNMGGVSCGASSPISMETLPPPASFDLSDDSEVVVRINYTNANCVGGTCELTFTK